MNPLVSAGWLSSRLNDPDTVVLDATLAHVGVTPPIDTRALYLERHIPGAVFFDIEGLSDHATSLPHMLPTPEDFARSMTALGVGSDMTIVVYEQVGVFSAPRAWWTLRAFGAQKVYMLDGGLRAWMDAGFGVESGPVQRGPARFESKLHREAVKDFDQVRDMIAGRAQIRPQIVDARSAGRFAGVLPEPRTGIESGHMPRAVNVPFTDLVEDGRLKPAEKLREVFAAKGVDMLMPITTTCGSGITAAVLALGLEIAGARSVSLYDGSWAEYAQRPEAVIHKGAGE